MKKFISIVLAILMTMSVFYSTNLLAGAATTTLNPTPSFGSNKIQTILNVPNNTYNNVTSTNLGGISVGTANNRLFCVKSNSDEEVGTLYYFDNIYDTGYQDGTKSPKKINFIDGLLGHANAMAIDSEYVYVTMATSTLLNKSKILQISRRAIYALADGAVVSNTNKTVAYGGSTINIYNILTPVTSTGATYDKLIPSITRYSYDSTTDTTKFIVSYYNGKKKMGFTFATLKDGVFTVSTAASDIFYVNNPYATDETPNYIVQDIFFDSAYGFYIAMWMNVADNNGYKTQNYVLRVRMKTLNDHDNRTVDPIQTISVNKKVENGNNVEHFEIESMAFVKKDVNNETTDYRFIFSCNKKLATNQYQTDSIEELLNFADVIPKSSTL